MLRLTLVLCLCFSLMGLACAERCQAAEPTEEETPEPIGTAQQLMQTMLDLWVCLCEVRDRKTADQSAERISELTRHATELDGRLSTYEVDLDDEQLVEQIELVGSNIASYIEIIHDEFYGICRARCYGSSKLQEVFRRISKTGLFAGNDLPPLSGNTDPLTEQEQTREVRRLGRLKAPDEQLLNTLRKVKDPATAEAAVKALELLPARYRDLLPDEEMNARLLLSPPGARLEAAARPLTQLLWGIRNEVVRIAGLPDYDGEKYNNFSDALDAVYSVLVQTHCNWADEVFDATFASDLSEALDAGSGSQSPSP